MGAFRENLTRGLTNPVPDKNNWTFDDFVLPRIREWRLGFQAKALGDFCEALGITRVKFHDLRATFITGMLSEGVPLVKVMAIVGHSEVSTTNEYLRLAGVDIKEGMTEKLRYRIGETPANILSLSRKS